jgi:hypothetical protein
VAGRQEQHGICGINNINLLVNIEIVTVHNRKQQAIGSRAGFRNNAFGRVKKEVHNGKE